MVRYGATNDHGFVDDDDSNNSVNHFYAPFFGRRLFRLQINSLVGHPGRGFVFFNLRRQYWVVNDTLDYNHLTERTQGTLGERVFPRQWTHTNTRHLTQIAATEEGNKHTHTHSAHARFPAESKRFIARRPRAFRVCVRAPGLKNLLRPGIGIAGRQCGVEGRRIFVAKRSGHIASVEQRTNATFIRAVNWIVEYDDRTKQHTHVTPRPVCVSLSLTFGLCDTNADLFSARTLARARCTTCPLDTYVYLSRESIYRLCVFGEVYQNG